MTTRGYSGRYIPKNPSKYLGDPHSIIFRSLLERSAMVYFDLTPAILEWSSEEVVVPYMSPLDNKMHRYFVDFHVKYVNSKKEIKSLLIEVKPEKQTQEPKRRKKQREQTYLTEVTTYLTNQAKWKAATAYAQKHGMEFKIITEKDIRRDKQGR